jgi:hypothetical protein
MEKPNLPPVELTFESFVTFFQKDITQACNYESRQFEAQIKELFKKTYEIDPGDIKIQLTPLVFREIAEHTFKRMAKRLYEAHIIKKEKMPEIKL